MSCCREDSSLVSRPLYGIALRLTPNHVHDGPPSRQGLCDCSASCWEALLGKVTRNRLYTAARRPRDFFVYPHGPHYVAALAWSIQPCAITGGRAYACAARPPTSCPPSPPSSSMRALHGETLGGGHIPHLPQCHVLGSGRWRMADHCAAPPTVATTRATSTARRRAIDHDPARRGAEAALCSLNRVRPQWLFWVLCTAHFFAEPP